MSQNTDDSLERRLSIVSSLLIPNSKQVRSVEELLADLSHSSWHIRALALHKLAALGNQVPLEPLLNMLQDEHVTVRATAVYVLGQQGTRTPFDVLLRSLRDRQWQVREQAVLALSFHQIPVKQYTIALTGLESQVSQLQTEAFPQRSQQNSRIGYFSARRNRVTYILRNGMIALILMLMLISWTLMTHYASLRGVTYVGSTVMSSPTEAVLSSPGPVSAWLFHEGTGKQTADASGNGNTGTLYGNVLWRKAGQGRTYALSLSATPGGYVDIPRAVVDTSQIYTVAAWVKLDSVKHWATAVSIDGRQNSAFYLQYCELCGTFAMSVVKSDTEPEVVTRATATIGKPVVGRWYHLVGLYDGRSHQLRLYVNGRVQGIQHLNTAWRGSGHTAIGRALSFGMQSDWWSGSIDDVRFYNRALTPQEIKNLA